MSFHIPATQSQVLAGKVGIVTGIANDQSIAYGCARALRDAGASLAITYLNEKARPHAEPLAGALGAELFLPLDVREAPQMTAVFGAIRDKWGRLDFLVHSLAFAPKADLQGRLVDSSVEGFLTAMDISCHSFVRMAKLAEPLMTGGGVLDTMSYYGADKVIANYSLMGPVKAALDAAVRYLAYELGPKWIRVHAVSLGPLKTRAASGLAHFDELLAEAELRAPERDLVDILDIGAATAFLCSPFAKLITGGTIYVDGGYNIRG
jgi:enoyl-[acyl-carrier protein] reductase I